MLHRRNAKIIGERFTFSIPILFQFFSLYSMRVCLRKPEEKGILSAASRMVA